MEKEKKTTRKKAEKKPAVKRVRKPKPVEAEVIKDEPEIKAEADLGLGDAASIEEKKAGRSNRYYEAVGRRKTSIARVRLFTQGDKEITVNGKKLVEYFPTIDLQKTLTSPLEKMKCIDHFKIVVIISGGGIHSQSEAVRHGISRALVEFNADFRKRLRRAGYLTRDPRARERKKFGLKRARRAPQWSKR